MKKIPTLFERNHDGDYLVRDEVTPGCEWVLAGEGVATRKRDGTCCMVKGGELFKRREVKKDKEPPEGFIPAGDRDPVTGKLSGWLPVTPEDKRHVEAWANEGPLRDLADGTYELVGPKVNGNPEGWNSHGFIRHGEEVFGIPRLTTLSPLTFSHFRNIFATLGFEGLVWHHPDGRMAKLKVKDFGFKREWG